MAEDIKNTKTLERYNRRTLTRILGELFKNNPLHDYTRDEIIETLEIRDAASTQILDLVIDDLIGTHRIAKGEGGTYHTVVNTGVIMGTLDLSKKGLAFVLPDDSDIEVAISNENLHNALHGDRVEVSLFAHTQNGTQEGEIIRIVKRARTTFVGTVEKSRNFSFLVPNHKTMPYDIFIPTSKLMKAQPGDKAVARITEWPEGAKNPIGEIIEVLGATGDHETEIHAILAEYGLPYAFPKDVEEEANNLVAGITDEEIASRRDVRDVTTFTIDPADAKDFDDAISIRWLDNGNYEIGVHIADVSHYIEEGSRLDEEALARGTSVYLVDRVVPMLPEALCNNICSLRQDEDKLTFSAIFELDENAHVVNEWFGKTVIRSNRRFCYEEAQAIIEGNDGDLKDEILKCWDLAKKLRDERFRNGSISFETAEIKFEIDEKGKPIRVYFKESKEANWLVEEFMLLANKRVATFIGQQKDKSHPPKTFVYRIHDEPDLEKLNSFQRFIGKFGYSINMNNEDLIAQSLNEVLAKVKGKAEQDAVSMLAVRSMAKAIYSTTNIGHYGLAFPYYTHFTSPIRRYPDLMVHRLLFRYLNGGKSANKSEYEKLCKHCSEREYLAVQAERASDKYKEVEYMRDHLGETFDAIISGITEWGVYAELEENKIEGMIPMRDLDDDFYQFDEENYCLVGHYTHKKYQLGDRLQIKIARANLERKQLDFVLATSEKFIETDPDKADAQNGGNRSGSSKKPKKPKELRTKPKKSGGKRSGKSKGKKH